jgi:hypothetical protein
MRNGDYPSPKWLCVGEKPAIRELERIAGLLTWVEPIHHKKWNPLSGNRQAAEVCILSTRNFGCRVFYYM